METPDRLTCEETFRRLEEYIDRELSPNEMRLVKEHLETCVACQKHYVFETTVVKDLRDKIRRIQLPTELSSRVRQAIEEAENHPSTED